MKTSIKMDAMQMLGMMPGLKIKNIRIATDGVYFITALGTLCFHPVGDALGVKVLDSKIAHSLIEGELCRIGDVDGVPRLCIDIGNDLELKVPASRELLVTLHPMMYERVLVKINKQGSAFEVIRKEIEVNDE